MCTQFIDKPFYTYELDLKLPTLGELPRLEVNRGKQFASQQSWNRSEEKQRALQRNQIALTMI